MPRRSLKAATEIAQYDREAKAVELRAQGRTFQQIADELKFSDASGASKAYHRALARKPAQNVNQIRAQEAERLEYLWRKTADVIENPPLAHSAIGKTIPDPRSPGEYLIDESARIRAMHEYRLQSESYRKMTGVDLAARAQPDPDADRQFAEAWAWVTDLAARVQELQAENGSLRAQLTRYERGDVVRAELVAQVPR